MHRRLTLNGPRHWLGLSFVAAASFFTQSCALAGDVKVETILTGLKSPSSVAVRPNGGGGSIEIFVTDRGAGRVIRVDGDKRGASVDAILGFPVNASSTSGAPCAAGVHTAFFLDHARLVAGGVDGSGKPLLRLYDLTESDAALKADEQKQDLELPNDADKSNRAVLCFHHLARTQPNDRVADMLVMAAATDVGAGTLWKVPVRANTLGEAAPFKVVNYVAKSGRIGGIVVGDDGYIAIASGSESQSGASTLKYVNPIDGRVVLTVEIDLPHIVGLAYHPTSQNLYAASVSADDQRGGVYRIDDATEPGKPAAVAVKVADAERPTAMSFGPDGALYVTTLGELANETSKPGKLLRLTGEL